MTLTPECLELTFPWILNILSGLESPSPQASLGRKAATFSGITQLESWRITPVGISGASHDWRASWMRLKLQVHSLKAKHQSFQHNIYNRKRTRVPVSLVTFGKRSTAPCLIRQLVDAPSFIRSLILTHNSPCTFIL